MDSLEQAQAQLNRQIAAYIPTDHTQIVTFQTEIHTPVDLLAWLKAQACYPQFYLNFRDSEQISVALGELIRFTDLNKAQVFLEQHDLPLIGGLQFHGETRLILPRLLFNQYGDVTFISLYAFSDQLDEALDFVKTLPKTTALCSTSRTIVQQKQAKADQNQWCNWVQQALTHIQQGNIRKVVLANETDYILSQPLNAMDFLTCSERVNQGCYHFIWSEEPSSFFVGSTPERLFMRNQNQLSTEALAGTAPANEDEYFNQQQAQWLLQDEKNVNENYLVVENICQNIAQYVTQIEVADLEIKPLRKVQHLIRHIQAKLKSDYQDTALLAALHPTAAVSGLPQQAAKQIVAQIESFPRSWYAGALGMISREKSEFCVAIRSAFIESRRLRVFAGAGIVAGSDPEQEWQEIERKAAGLVSLLQE